MNSKRIYIFIFFLTAVLYGQTGRQVELKKINFQGNKSISSNELLQVILSKESPNWISQFLNKFTSFGDKAVYFDSLLIPTDMAAIQSLYQSNGFFKVRVKNSYSIDTASSEATLNYIINEGEEAHFRNFKIAGLNNIPGEYKDILLENAKVDTTTVYRDAIVEEKKNFTITFLRDHGYMLANYDTPNVFIDTIQNKIDVDINFNTGKRYQISDITVNQTGKGENLVSDDLLKEIVGITPGQWYSNYDIQRAQVRLYRTGLFNSALVNSVISDTTDSTVPINITADVGSLNELSPEIIANDEESFSLGLGLSFIKKNFLGDARKFTISSSAAIQNVSQFIKNPTFKSSNIYGYGDLRASIEQPFLFGKTVNTRLESYLTGQKLKDEYNSTLFGGKLSLDFELPQFTYFNSLSVYFYIERAKFIYQEKYLTDLISIYFQRKELIPANDADSLAAIFVKDELGGSYSTASTNTLLGISSATNKTDDLFFPTRGYTLSLQIEDANSIPYLFSKILKTDFNRPLFFKTILSTTAYLPFYDSRENAFGVKFRIGQLFNYKGDKADIPLNQRLYAGGSNSVRGWGTRELVPANELITLNDVSAQDIYAYLAQGAPTGGFFLLEGSFETRNRIIGKVGSALFVDYGNTWNSVKEFRFDEVAIAAGFGLRYYSDFAPIRIDFGFKIYDPINKKFTFEKDFWKNVWKNYLQFHIGIGEAF